MEECCLCSRSVEIGGSKKKRKRLYGSACSVSRGVLEKLADQLSSTGSKKFAEVNGPQAFLCHLCDGKLQSIPRHEEQLRALRAEISTQLQSVLHDSDTDEEIPQSAGRKRCSEDASSLSLSDKAPRLDPQPSLPRQDQPQGVSQEHPEQLTCLQLPEETSHPPSVIPEQSLASHSRPSPLPATTLDQSVTSPEKPTSLQQSPAITVC